MEKSDVRDPIVSETRSQGLVRLAHAASPSLVLFPQSSVLFLSSVIKASTSFRGNKVIQDSVNYIDISYDAQFRGQAFYACSHPQRYQNVVSGPCELVRELL